jgi:hypothetical protein
MQTESWIPAHFSTEVFYAKAWVILLDLQPDIHVQLSWSWTMLMRVKTLRGSCMSRTP